WPLHGRRVRPGTRRDGPQWRHGAVEPADPPGHHRGDPPLPLPRRRPRTRLARGPPPRRVRARRRRGRSRLMTLDRDWQLELADRGFKIGVGTNYDLMNPPGITGTMSRAPD